MFIQKCLVAINAVYHFNDQAFIGGVAA